jgi:UDP-glucose 4-epimerase
MNKILVTGAYGYIGSHICKEAHRQGYEVYATDINRSVNDITPYCKEIELADITLKEHYDKRIFQREYLAVIHCAALILVEESVKTPEIYYDTNSYGTLLLAQRIKCNNFIFASTGGAFNPISPYAKSKVIAEEIIRTTRENYNIFRFFNVAGNNGEFRQICTPSHIIHIAARTAANKRPYMEIYGDDYFTPDGTCIRDYIHVEDIAKAIVRSIYCPRNRRYECLGSGRGYSNIQVVEAMRRISNNDFIVKFGHRRAGDPDVLKVDEISEFLTIQKTFDDMCRSAYQTEIDHD